MKAQHWRTLFDIYIPLALLSLWQTESPIAAENAAQMGPALHTVMHLTCASIMMNKSNLTGADRERFRHSYRQHVLGLKSAFPGFELPSHHLVFHMYEFMDLFSNVRNWSCYNGERLIGKLRRIPNNHKIGTKNLVVAVTILWLNCSWIGEFEGTLLHSFHKGSALKHHSAITVFPVHKGKETVTFIFTLKAIRLLNG
jgi:hypothetical protein